MCTLEDLDVSLKFGVATFAALSMQRPEIELRWERVEALKLVQQIIRLKILNKNLETILMRNITNNLGSWKKDAQSKIIAWKEKLKQIEKAQ